MRLDWRAAIGTSLAQAGIAALLAAITAVRFGEGWCHMCIKGDPFLPEWDVTRLNAFMISPPVDVERASHLAVTALLSPRCGSATAAAKPPRLLSTTELPASAVSSNPLRLCVRVNASGTVERVRTPSANGFDPTSLQAIRRAARQLRFAPAMRAGRPVEVEVELTLVANVPRSAPA